MASDWHRNGLSVLAWSPLYAAFYGAFLHLTDNAFFVTTAHRMAIVLLLAMMVLLLMRRLLPAALAWVLTAWWVVMPINFDSLYEVHLFAVIPILAALWLGSTNSQWGLGAALGVLLTSALLIRNEMMIPFAVLAAAATSSEVHQGASRVAALRGRFRVAPFLVFPLVAVVLFLFFDSRTRDVRSLADALDQKQRLNTCQVFAFGYQQRHSDFAASPWTGCQQLMMRTYGEPEPTLIGAVRKNPKAVMEHFGWNVSLIPNGLQVLLLNAMSGTVSPDYVPVVARDRLSLWLSIALIVLVLCGTFLLIRDWAYWRETLLDRQRWFWVTAAGLAIVSVVVMITQRPRPSYLLGFGIVVRVVVGIMLVIVAARFPVLQRLGRAYPAAAILLIVLMPSYYLSGNSPRPLATAYRRLKPFAGLFQTPGVKFVSLGSGQELCSYLSYKEAHCRATDYSEILSDVGSGASLADALARRDANILYADGAVLRDGFARKFAEDPEPFGWVSLAHEKAGAQSWSLLAKGTFAGRWLSSEQNRSSDQFRRAETALTDSRPSHR